MINKNFYPTPQNIVSKMIEGVELNGLNILDLNLKMNIFVANLINFMQKEKIGYRLINKI